MRRGLQRERDRVQVDRESAAPTMLLGSIAGRSVVGGRAAWMAMGVFVGMQRRGVGVAINHGM